MEKSYRFELKYPIPIDDREIMDIARQTLTKFGMRPDNPSKYNVTSLYYDTYDFCDYYDKIGGFLKRRKIRFRVYEKDFVSAPYGWLEVKNKYEQKNHKIRALIPGDKINDFLYSDTGLSSVYFMDSDKVEKDRILWDYIRFSYTPNLVVRYEREAYVDDLSGLRITFDSNLEASKWDYFRYDSCMFPVARCVVMEVKFNLTLPFWFARLVREFDLKRDTFSKYGLSLESVFRHKKPLQ